MSRVPGPLFHDFLSQAVPPRSPGPLGFCDAADPNCHSEPADTPGPLGRYDYSQMLADAGSTVLPVHKRKTAGGKKAAEGRRPTAKQLSVLMGAQRIAVQWCDAVVKRLSEANRFVLGSGDPRLYPPLVLSILTLFEVHFKSRAAVDIHEITENVATIRKFLAALGKRSYRVVPNAIVDAADEEPGGGDVFAYVRGREPVIYLAERAFGVDSAIARSSAVRGRVIVQTTVEARELNDSQRVRLLIHESAHASLGVMHSGGKGGFDLEACGAGVPKVRSYAQASQNAYCYDLFAFCASR